MDLALTIDGRTYYDSVYDPTTGLVFDASTVTGRWNAEVSATLEKDSFTSLETFAQKDWVEIRELAIDQYARVWTAVSRPGEARLRVLDCAPTAVGI